MTTAPSFAPRSEKVRRRWPWVLGLFALALALPLGYVVLKTYLHERERVEFYAELDQTDPGWRLDDIEAGRKILHDRENSALRVLSMQAQLKQARFPSGLRESLFQKLRPEQQLHEIQSHHVWKLLEPLAGLRDEVRKLKDQPEGRYPLTYRPDWISTTLEHVQKAREVARFLQYDAMLRAQDRDLASAAEDCEAMLNTARSIGDEPMAISFLVRIACDHIMMESLERTLAQGTLPDAALLRLQTFLEREREELLLTNCLRGERAGVHHLYTALRQGKITLSSLTGVVGKLRSAWLDYLTVPLLEDETIHLQHLTSIVEASKHPLERQELAIRKVEGNVPDLLLVNQLLGSSYSNIAKAHLRNQAYLRSAYVALAAERYRLKKKHWPASLDVLVNERLLTKLPTDPYDGQPLRGRAWAEGYVVYAVGPDLLDNGGTIDRETWNAPNTDLGFRLWDEARRRQPPMAPEEDAPEPE